jgi:phosphatidylglycerol:prolipoprotein diacylglycerol transferase
MGITPSAYVLLNGTGLIIALFVLDRRLKERLPARHDAAYVFFVLAVPLGWICAHVLDALVTARPLLQSGFTFYGGLLSASAFFIATAAFYLRRDEIGAALDAAVLPLLLAHAVGRIGCFAGGCCFGRFITGTRLRHPTPLYECLFLLGLAWVLPRLRRRYHLTEAKAYLLAYPSFRFVVEFLRADNRGGAYGLSTSQWISMALIIVGMSLLLKGSGPSR